MADISRADALAILARQDINEIISPETSGSAALASFRTIRMSAGVARMPVLSALPTAGFVTDNNSTDASGLKPTSKISWIDKELVAEEIAVIVPVHENTLADANFDIWGQVRPLVSQEFGRILDGAVFFGANKPATWTDQALVPGAIAAGNQVVAGTGIDLAEDFNDAFGEVEDDEFDVNVAFTGRFLRRQLRGLRDADNAPIYLDGLRSDNNTASVFGQDLYYVRNRSWDKTQALALVGDRESVVIGIREDVQVKLLDQATLDMGGGNLVHLAQRDMVALRFKFRVAFATAYSTAAGEATDYPFAVITPDPTPEGRVASFSGFADFSGLESSEDGVVAPAGVETTTEGSTEATPAEVEAPAKTTTARKTASK